MEIITIVISGVLVFIVGEIFVRFLLGPIHRLKETKGEIARVLLFHANNYGNKYVNIHPDFSNDENIDERVLEERISSMKKWNDDLSKAADDTRDIAAKLIENAEAVPCYKIIAFMRLIPSKKNIIDAKAQLIGLSNSFTGDQQKVSSQRTIKICKLLNIQFGEDL